MIKIYVESEDTYKTRIDTDFDPTAFNIDFAFKRKDGSASVVFTPGAWLDAATHPELEVWQRNARTPKIGPDVGDIQLSVGDWNCFARIGEIIFFVDQIEVVSAGVGP